MEKLIKNLVKVSLCVILGVLILSSCSEDDKSDNSIVGTWTSDRFYGGVDTYVFNKNGTYTWTYKGTADWFTDHSGTYTYNRAILTIKRKSGRTDVYVVIGLTNTSLVIMDDEGDSYTYYRK